MNNVDFEKAETNYNKQYDPHADPKCPVCLGDNWEEAITIEGIHVGDICTNCGYMV